MRPEQARGVGRFTLLFFAQPVTIRQLGDDTVVDSDTEYEDIDTAVVDSLAAFEDSVLADWLAHRPISLCKAYKLRRSGSITLRSAHDGARKGLINTLARVWPYVSEIGCVTRVLG